MSEWCGYILEDYQFNFGPASVIIDVGCGEGFHVAKLTTEGHFVVGIDLNPSRVSPMARSHIVQGRAEALPFRNNCADGVLIKVVLPYTDICCAQASGGFASMDCGQL